MSDQSHKEEADIDWRAISARVCPSCSLVEPQLENRSCPQCGMALLPLSGDVEAFMTSWDDSAKCYNLKVVFAVSRLSGPQMSAIVAALPQAVADRSNCSCGESLSIGNHSISVQEGKLTFEARYGCKSCYKPRRKGKFGRLGSVFWRDTTKIQIGLDGLTYEKNTSDGQGPT
jgi:hypothetical protein